jgi:dTDP-4-dehydrorhamnose 3,5-epimerase
MPDMPMPVTFHTTEIPGVLVIETGVFRDQRGFFSESYNREVWAEKGFVETFVQDNISLSVKGTLRGMHYQLEPHGMGKLVRVVHGAVFDVAVDIRCGSPTYGQWVGRELSGSNGLSLWVPPGFAHGFVALGDNTLVAYKCSACHAPASERSLSYACPKVGIDWPLEPTVISDKDAAAPGLDEAETNFDWND